MRFCSLGSGSEGNALVVEAHDRTLLFDCGFSLRETLHRLSRVGLTPEELDAIFVTHEHADHVRGVAALAKRYRLTVFATFGTYAAASEEWSDLAVECFDADQDLSIGPIRVQSFTVPHDAREPVQYVIEGEGQRLGILTDVGSLTGHIVQSLSECSALFLEANHCEQMLQHGPYPPGLKARVGGDYGHLSNTQAAQLLAAVASDRLQSVVAGHLSQQNNTETGALACLRASLSTLHRVRLSAASQEHGCAWENLAS